MNNSNEYPGPLYHCIHGGLGSYSCQLDKTMNGTFKRANLVFLDWVKHAHYTVIICSQNIILLYILVMNSYGIEDIVHLFWNITS